MPGQVPANIWLYRLTHYHNLPHILDHGLVNVQHAEANPGFVGIGDSTLIPIRKIRKVDVPPYGQLGDYVPFYLGSHSPMLLQIKTGSEGVKTRSQGELIYLISSIETLKKENCQFCFSDGHAWNKMTRFYSDENDWDKIDWDMVKAHYWRNTEEDKDRQRRKQAEVLVHNKVSVNCIEAIIVYDEERLKFVKELLEEKQLLIPVHLSKKHYY